MKSFIIITKEKLFAVYLRCTSLRHAYVTLGMTQLHKNASLTVSNDGRTSHTTGQSYNDRSVVECL